jgi:hypothetical protein
VQSGINHLLTLARRVVAWPNGHSYGRIWGLWQFAAAQCDGSKMHRVIAVVIAGASLGGCSSFSLDYFKPTPPTIQVQLESTPPGADARTSVGPGCKTPCSVSVAAPDTGFSVSYSLNKFQPATVQVQVIRNPGDLASPATTVTDPNPVFAELAPAGPPPKAERKMRPRKPRAPKPAAAAPGESSFPDPNAAPATTPAR